MPQDLEKRVEILENKVELLEQLREEMRVECSAVRTELRYEIVDSAAGIRAELRQEIRAGDQETQRLMRVLHEEVLARIKTLRRR